MYYIIELADGTQFIFDDSVVYGEDGYTLNIDLPEDCTSFTVVDPSRANNGVPYNFRVVKGSKMSLKNNDMYYHNGNIMRFDPEKTKVVQSYEDLNAEYRSCHAIQNMLSR